METPAHLVDIKAYNKNANNDSRPKYSVRIRSMDNLLCGDGHGVKTALELDISGTLCFLLCTDC